MEIMMTKRVRADHGLADPYMGEEILYSVSNPVGGRKYQPRIAKSKELPSLSGGLRVKVIYIDL